MADATIGLSDLAGRCLARRQIIAGTALTGVLATFGWGGAALAQSAYDVVISGTETAPIDMDTRHSGGGILHLEQGGSLSVTSNTQNAINTSTSNAWEFQIDGTLRADGTAGGIASHTDDTVKVGSTGILESLNGGAAIYNGWSGMTVENSGRITSDKFSIMIANDTLSLTNNAGATIEGTVQMATGGTSSTIDNYGSISGRDGRAALSLAGDATIYNRAGATMSSEYNAITATSGVGYLENDGSLTSTNTTYNQTAAAAFYKSGTVVNSATGTMSADIGAWIGNWYELSSTKGTLTNDGTITGKRHYGALFYNLMDANLTNTGTLQGATDGATFSGMTNGEITNSGTITGNRGLYFMSSSYAPTGHASITNSGTIEGTGTYALEKTSGISYDLTLDTGSNLIGQVQADSGDTLTLKGTGSEDEDLKGFGSLTMAGNAWTLSGSVQADALTVSSGTLTLTGTDLSFGSVDLASASKLIVNGNFNSSGETTVASGSRLGGSGTFGEITVQSGGILSPGNSIGTLSVTGDVIFDAGSVYEIETDPTGTSSDKTIASGDIVINGGAVQHIGFDGTYDPSATYRILEGGTGLTGAFDSVTSDYAYLDPSLVYDRGNYTVDLKLLRNDISFSDKVGTTNQRAVSAVSEAAGHGNAVFDAAAFLPDDTAVLGAAFDSLSGELHASLQSSLVENTDLLRTTLGQRLRSIGANGAPEGEGYTSRAATGADMVRAADAPEIWVEGFGAWDRKDGNDNAAALRENTGGFLVGADMTVSEATHLGVFAGYGRTELDVSERASSATADSFHIGAYGSRSFAAGSGLLSLRGGASYSLSDVDSDRTVAVGALTGAQTANYHAGTAQVFGEAGWSVDLGLAEIEPFAGLAWVGLNTDSFTEDGGAAALAGQSQDMSTLFTTLGTRGSAQIEIGTLPLELTGALGWRHAYGDVTPLSTASFDGGAAFTVEGAPVIRDVALLEAGASLSLSDMTQLTVGYKGQIGDNVREHALTLRLSARF
ncbi:autotransporter outer membrane beta-barrel domain-containing protein [Rhodovulum sulfidophilum]|uniref:autotransporter outer membrane beta-barrel domain-containing protein n=1 Tax=Rhodovulum sulfidophilum TaxID=35806 RepID=UPI00138A2786|nr:autotransporter domain-containing protein [Rhodovulum sulfidophilum]NDK37009.1 autotransporter domain-containing protein [Rhodovulum sulfidophilum]